VHGRLSAVKIYTAVVPFPAFRLESGRATAAVTSRSATVFKWSSMGKSEFQFSLTRRSLSGKILRPGRKFSNGNQ
jgi:hypothetical protein